MRLNILSELQVIEVKSYNYSWLYLNGKLIWTAAHMDLEDFSNAINKYLEENSYGSYMASVFGINYQCWDIKQEYTERGSLPELLKDIPEEMFE